jgi:thiamine biosynthesis protein ThiI
VTILLIRYSEIALKTTKVRKRFEQQLKDNLLTMLMEDGVEAFVTERGARYYVQTSDIDAAIRSIRKVFGVASVSIAEEYDSSMEAMCAAAAEYSKGKLSEGESFAVRARREGSHDYTSMDVGREVGSAIFLANEHLGVKVDLTKPEKEFFVEVRDNKAYLYTDTVKCHAGLPISTQGRVVAFVDDDRGMVSAWLMMKRGCRVSVRGTYGFDDLKAYDPLMRTCDKDPKNTLGYVMGTSLEDLDKVDVSAYSLPVFFPTVGMTDEEVAAIADTIRNRL